MNKTRSLRGDSFVSTNQIKATRTSEKQEFSKQSLSI